MKRAVICSRKPWEHIPRYKENYSLMIVDPDCTPIRMQYLLTQSDYSLLVTDDETQTRNGKVYDDEAMVLYTSGTTGDSKFYSFSQKQIDQKCKILKDRFQINKSDRYFGVMPLWHTHGLSTYLAVETVGCEREFGTIKDLKKLQSFQPSIISAIPDILQTMLPLELENLRYIRSGSSALSSQLLTRLQDRFEIPVLEAFGMTEALGFCMSNPIENPRDQTVGLPFLDYKIDPESRLWLKAPWCFTDQWFDTGDLAEQDDHGYLRILGRSVDQLNIRAKKFNPVSIEKHLIENIAGLKQCVIFGKHSLGCLYIGECNETSIKNFLISLDPHLRPSLLQKVDVIPFNNGKISRTLLTKKYLTTL
jgi:long-subunit acyl-CoA synthetase (AMP-forming)